MFINNNFSPFISIRPPFARIENDEEEDEIFYSTNIDSFDEQLYKINLKSAENVSTLKERRFTRELFKYKHSENLHFLIYPNSSNVETFDNLSNKKPFLSSQGLKINLKTKYKLQLTNSYKNERGHFKKKNKIVYTIDDDPKIDKSLSSSIFSSDLKQSEKEKDFFDKARVRNSLYKPTRFKTGLKKGVVNVKFEDTVRQVMQVEDSIFNSCHDAYLRKNSTRPQFVDDLFKKYDYQDIDPWKKIQNRTKDKSLCLSVLQDIYNKIKTVFG